MSDAVFDRCLLDDPTNGTFGMPRALSLASPLSHVTLSNLLLATKAKVFGAYLAYVVEGACPPSANVTTVGGSDVPVVRSGLLCFTHQTSRIQNFLISHAAHSSCSNAESQVRSTAVHTEVSCDE